METQDTGPSGEADHPGEVGSREIGVIEYRTTEIGVLEDGTAPVSYTHLTLPTKA